VSDAPTDPALAPLSPAEQRALVRLGLQAAALFGAVFLLGAIAATWLRAPLQAAGEGFVAEVGAPGVAVVFLLADLVPVPIPPDLFSVFARLGGVPFWTIVAWGTLGALGGSALAWSIGRLLAHTAWFRRALGHQHERVAGWVRRWGGLALVIVIVSPIPFEVGAWTASALGMPLWRLLLWASLRGFRIAGYLALFQLGWVQAG
jgi:membrane protein YqaA with SNARE-associated domain